MLSLCIESSELFEGKNDKKMFVVEKNIESVNIQILVDYAGNGRVMIDSKQTLCRFDGSKDNFKSLLDNGWVSAPKSSPLRMQKGGYVGNPRIVDFLPSWIHDTRIHGCIYVEQDRKFYITPPKWIEEVIRLLLIGDIEVTKTKKCVNGRTHSR